MTTATIHEPETTALKPILYTVTEATIEQQTTKFLALSIKGIDDKKGYEIVRQARMECVHARRAIEKTRQELKSYSLEYGRKVDAEAKRLTQMIEPVEQYLQAQQDGIDAQKKRIEEEARLTRRTERLRQASELCLYDFVVNFEVEDMTAEQWAKCLEDAKLDAEQEREKREAREENERRLREENERLAKERKELEEQRAELARQQAELKRQQDEAAQKAREAERLERERADAVAREEQAKQRAAELAAREEEQRRRNEALKPDREKLLAVADTVALIEVPSVSDELADVAIEIRKLLSETSKAITRIVNNAG